MFANYSHFHPSLVFAGKSGLTKVEPSVELNCVVWVPILSQNNRLGWRELTLANTLAYYDTATIFATKSFKVHASCVCNGKFWRKNVCKMPAKCLQNACKMPAKCLQNACIMPAKCLHNACKMPAKCLQKCLQNACKMPAKCLQNSYKMPANAFKIPANACKMPATEATNTNNPLCVEMPKKAEATTDIVISVGADLNCHLCLGKNGRHDIQHHDIQHHDFQHNGVYCDTQHNDTWHNH